MNLWRFLRKMDFSTLWDLLKLSLKHFLYIIPTIRATNLTVKLSNTHFGKLHHDNNETNGFRHALWNVLIAKNCLKWNKNIERVLIWTEKITDWHEEFSPNKELAKAMDLHNNHIGRILFQKHHKSSLPEFIALLKIETNASVFIKSIAEIEKNKFNLVHIEINESI